MRRFKDKKGVIYNISVDSIAKVFENSSEYSEIKEKNLENKKNKEKNLEISENKDKSE